MTEDSLPYTTPEMKRARVEIIPLIDVIFFLLATFVLFTLSLSRIQSLPLTLPRGGDGEPQKEMVTLQVSEPGVVYWNKELLSISEVPIQLARHAASNDPHVLITSDSLAKYGDTIQVLDMVRQAGIEKVTIETTFRRSGG